MDDLLDPSISSNSQTGTRIFRYLNIHDILRLAAKQPRAKASMSYEFPAFSSSGLYFSFVVRRLGLIRMDRVGIPKREVRRWRRLLNIT